MPDRAAVTHYFPFAGANASTDGTMLTAESYEMACNVILKNGTPATRFGVRNIPYSMLNGDVDDFATGNGQGYKFHNPSKGQSVQVFSEDESYIMAAVAGKKYTIQIDGQGVNTQAKVSDITNGLDSNRQLHLVWWESAEIYALANDGFSNLFIWDRDMLARNTAGYNTVDKEDSKLPNGGTVILYVHNRVAVVIDGRFIIYGDIIHKLNRYSPENILNATEQVHWATGPFIVPPSNMGNILSAAVLPLRDTAHGHGAGIFHCDDGGQFSVASNLAFRADWEKTAMIKISDLNVAASGPYSVDQISGDQMFRSSRGIDSIRSAIQETKYEGNQQNGIGDALNRILEMDNKSYLRFASLKVWADAQRVLCTIHPVVRGRWRYHRALISKNLDTYGFRAALPAWEGMVTFAEKNRNIIQMVGGKWAGRERLFAFTREDSNLEDPGAGVNRIVEFDERISYDTVEDESGVNTPKDISCWIKTRKLSYQQPLMEKGSSSCKVFFKDVRTYETECFKFAVYSRSNRHDEWAFYRGGKITTKKQDLTNTCKDYSVEVPLGMINECHNGFRWIQFLIKWTGQATLESFLAMAEVTGLQNEMDFDSYKLTLTPKCFNGSCNHDDYEYSIGDAPEWHKELDKL